MPRCSYRTYCIVATCALLFIVFCIQSNMHDFHHTSEKGNDFIFHGEKVTQVARTLNTEFGETDATKQMHDAETQKAYAAFSTNSISTRRKVVIILTQRRSGSSVLGELFNQKLGVPFFYEPVFPFGELPCEGQWENRTQVVTYIANCNFDRLKALYTAAFERTKRDDKYAR